MPNKQENNYPVDDSKFQYSVWHKEQKQVFSIFKEAYEYFKNCSLKEEERVFLKVASQEEANWKWDIMCRYYNESYEN